MISKTTRIFNCIRWPESKQKKNQRKRIGKSTETHDRKKNIGSIREWSS